VRGVIQVCLARGGVLIRREPTPCAHPGSDGQRIDPEKWESRRYRTAIGDTVEPEPP